MRAVLVTLALLAGTVPALADEAHTVAADVIAKTTSDDSVDKVFALMRTNLIGIVRSKSGKDAQEAGSIVDQIVMPSLRRSVPMIKSAVVEIYVRNYSLDDLRGLDAFYGTTLGQHLIAKQPQIAAAMAPTIIGIVQAQLMQVLQEKAQELRQRGVTL